MENRAKDLELDFIALGRHLARRWIWLIAAAAVGLAGGWAAAKATKERFYSEVIFVPDKSGSLEEALPNLGLLTGKFGMPGQGTESPFVSHFEDFLKTRSFSEGLLELARGDSVAPLLRRVYGEGITDSITRFRGVVGSALKATRKEGLYRIESTTPEPALSHALAEAAFSAFKKRLTDASMESLMRNLEFLNALVAKNRAELERNSDAVRRFLESNRDVSSPQLSQAKHELAMNVKLSEEKYILSVKELETLKIKKEKDEASIVVIEPPFLNPFPVYPSRARFMAAGAFLALFTALAVLAVAGRRTWIAVAARP